MRIGACACVLALASCGQKTRCDLVSRGTIAFSSAEAPDTVETRAIGESCNAAAAAFIVRDAGGVPIWAWAAPFYPTFGDAFAPHAEGAGPGRVQIADFVSRWTRAEALKTSAAPAWAPEVETSLERRIYDDIRARDLPMLCFLVGVARQQCIYWEPAAATADAFYLRDIGPPPPPEEDGRSDRK
ncbi:MAG: hypothetical protein JNJ73_09145 [Hyphomonadaceae bacterium]|nr:hypothetical protein [Hyphomonadaceae bacterium]